MYVVRVAKLYGPRLVKLRPPLLEGCCKVRKPMVAFLLPQIISQNILPVYIGMFGE